MSSQGQYSLILTGDGSHTLRDERLGVTYHSIHGAVQESRHVFIETGLHHVIEKQDLSEIRVMEMGLGTGLNAFLALLVSDTTRIPISYTALEAYPLPDQITDVLDYPDFLGCPNRDPEYRAILKAPANTTAKISGHFDFTPLYEKLESVSLDSLFDLVFFDAFAPSAQPELWGVDALAIILPHLCDGAVLVTYCAQGQFKRNLRSLGFQVESLPGPPGKREITRATFRANPDVRM